MLKKKIILLIILLSAYNLINVDLLVGSNYYDLSVGTTRYYDIYGAYGIAYTGENNFIAIEKIIGDTIIGSTIYAKVNWRAQIVENYEGLI